MRWAFMAMRCLTAAALFLILTEVNVWGDTQSHLVLAVGYRTFLLCAPALMVFGLRTAMISTLVLSLLAAMASFGTVNPLTMGAFAMGMAISGYLFKYTSSATSRGTADNKVALNVGSLIAGLLIMMTTKQDVLIPIVSCLLLVCVGLCWKIDWNALHAPAAKRASMNSQWSAASLGWALIGIATGIKLTGVFSVLPQYLLSKTGALPSWFGSLIILNSLVVIFLQHGILRFLDKQKPWLTFAVSLSTMIVLAVPAWVGAENLWVSVGWILMLTAGECALSRFDRLAHEANALLIKEVMVGVGSFLTVWLSRNHTADIYLSGVVGCACLTLGCCLVGEQKLRRVLRSLYLLMRERLGGRRWDLAGNKSIPGCLNSGQK